MSDTLSLLIFYRYHDNRYRFFGFFSCLYSHCKAMYLFHCICHSFFPLFHNNRYNLYFAHSNHPMFYRLHRISCSEAFRSRCIRYSFYTLFPYTSNNGIPNILFRCMPDMDFSSRSVYCLWNPSCLSRNFPYSFVHLYHMPPQVLRGYTDSIRIPPPHNNRSPVCWLFYLQSLP